MFPNSVNAVFELLSISSLPDELGVRKQVITSRRKVSGMVKSITSSDYQTSVAIGKKLDFKVVIQSFVYRGEKFILKNKELLKVERTYENGMFVELYLTKSDIQLGE